MATRLVFDEIKTIGELAEKVSAWVTLFGQAPRVTAYCDGFDPDGSGDCIWGDCVVVDGTVTRTAFAMQVDDDVVTVTFLRDKYDGRIKQFAFEAPRGY